MNKYLFYAAFLSLAAYLGNRNNSENLSPETSTVVKTDTVFVTAPNIFSAAKDTAGLAIPSHLIRYPEKTYAADGSTAELIAQQGTTLNNKQ